MKDSLTERQGTVNTQGSIPRTAAGDAFSAVVVQVFRLNGLLSAAGDALAKPAGQSTARWQVLAAAEHGPATVAQVARTLNLARQSVQRVANVLVAEGSAVFETNPKDKRADLLVLTDAGLAALREIQAHQQVWADALGGAVGEEALNRALKVLEGVEGALTRSTVLE